MVLKFKLKNYVYFGFCITFIILLAILLEIHPAGLDNKFCGGEIITMKNDLIEHFVPVDLRDEDALSKQFQRPSNQPPLPNMYSYTNFEGKPGVIFKTPEDVIHAYYGILQEASNMDGYTGGCGTVGYATLPYPNAYELLSTQYKNTISLKNFIKSFEGIGHITLLKLYPTYSPPTTHENIKYYMVEIEVITGEKVKNIKENEHISYFAYYYGIVSVINEPNSGWKIDNIYYLPESFLCAPYHSWFYFSDAFVEIVFGENLKLIDKIDEIDKSDDIIHVFASKKGKRYKFDFVRLTNGYDILLHEYVLENDNWKEVNLLTENWQDYKLTIKNFNKSN